MPSALDIIGLVLSIVSVSELLKLVLRLFADRLPSGRQQKVEMALENIDVRLRRIKRNRYISGGGAEREKYDQLAKQLDVLSIEIEEWEEKGLRRFFDYPGAIKLLRRCRELEKSVADLRTRLRHIESTRLHQEPQAQPSRSAMIASGVEPSYGFRMQQMSQTQHTFLNPNPAFQPSSPPLGSRQLNHRTVAAKRRQPRSRSPQQASLPLATLDSHRSTGRFSSTSPTYVDSSDSEPEIMMWIPASPGPYSRPQSPVDSQIRHMD